MGTLDDYFKLSSLPADINYSAQALQYSKSIRLCDNYCGAYIYNVPWEEKPLNAEVSKKDSLHEKTCSILNGVWMIAGASNWYPDGTFLKPTERLIEGIIKLQKKELTVKQLFEEIESLYKTAIQLDGSLHARQVKNEEYRTKWKQEKERKKAERERRAGYRSNNNNQG